MSVHEAARKKLVGLMNGKGFSGGIVLLQGGSDQNQYDTDTELLFRQDSWFNYLFGVKEPGLFGALSLSTGKSTLFIPRLPDEYRIWCGEILPPSTYKASYAVDEVVYLEDLFDWINTALEQEGEGSKLHLMKGVNSDSGIEAKPAAFPGVEKLYESGTAETGALYDTLALCRVIKSAEEIEAMRYVALVASNAHVEVMRTAHECSFEYELEAKFLYEIYRKGGCRKCAYTCIGACGPSSAVLHYGHAGAPNDRALQHNKDMALLDMGAEYHGYVSDITCSFPFSGQFTADQKAIYEGVLSAQRAVLSHMVPGSLWTDCHKLAEREILSSLIALGVLHNGTVDEMAEAHVGAVFFPHGLGHLIGCDTHDVGGYIPGTPAKQLDIPGLNKLRTSRLLEAGMVLTNEPGCYFIDALLDAALADPARAPFINEHVLSRFRGFGGVRLEDVVLVTEASGLSAAYGEPRGPESLSTCPRTTREIERVMAGGSWPPEVDEAPYLKRRWTKLAANGLGMEDVAVEVRQHED